MKKKTVDCCDSEDNVLTLGNVQHLWLYLRRHESLGLSNIILHIAAKNIIIILIRNTVLHLEFTAERRFLQFTIGTNVGRS